MEIDVRTQYSNEKVIIRFGSHEVLEHAGDDLGHEMDQTGFYIRDNTDRSNVCIFTKDIDNLIKALEKAKELWV